MSQRIRQLRLARGLSLDALAAEMGGIVTKQALLKYEQGKARPSPSVMVKLASALGVKAAYLWSSPPIRVEFVAYRKKSRLPKREQERVESLVQQTLEDRFRVQELLNQVQDSAIPVQSMPVRNLEDAEKAAEKLRTQWNLGSDAISSVTDVLEDHYVHVIEIEANKKFDGISAVAENEKHGVKAAAVVTRRDVPGERQRLDITHELGHLVLNVNRNVDGEKAAFRFGTAFLAPASSIYRDVGRKRVLIPSDELCLLKRRYGMSLQALLHRLHDLDIITDSYYRQWCIDINRLGWRLQEPLPLPREKPKWMYQMVLRGLTEGWVTSDEAERLVDGAMQAEPPLSLVQRRAFMKLPLEERRRLMAEQASRLADYYEQSPEVD